MDNQKESFEAWAVVELFGHQQIAGLVTEQQVGGVTMLRVDVPEVNGHPAFTRFFGGSAIYSLTPCSQELAIAALRQIRPRPITTYVPELQQLAARSSAPADLPDDLDETW